MGEERSCGGDGNRDVLARMGLARRTSRSAIDGQESNVSETRVALHSGDENQGLPRRTGAPAPTRRPAIPRRPLGRRDRQVPRDLGPVGLALARLLPQPRPGGPDSSPRTGPATQADRHPGEDRPAVATGQPRRARVRYRAVDRPSAGPVDRGGVRHPVQPPVAHHVAEGPRLHPPEARAPVPRERDPGAIAAWLASDWPRIKRKARRQGARRTSS